MRWFLALKDLRRYCLFYPISYNTKPNSQSYAHVSPLFTWSSCICLTFDWVDGLTAFFLIGLSNSFGFSMPYCITVALLNVFVTFPYKRSCYISIFALAVRLSLITFCHVRFCLTLRRHYKSGTIGEYLLLLCEEDCQVDMLKISLLSLCEEDCQVDNVENQLISALLLIYHWNIAQIAIGWSRRSLRTASRKLGL